MFGFGLLLLVLFFSWAAVRTYYDIIDTPITLARSLSGADRIKLSYLEIDLKEQDPREPSFRGKLYLYFHKYGADGPRQVTVFRSSDRGYGRSRIEIPLTYSDNALNVPIAAFTLTYHQVTGESGYTLDRGFCPECGSPVLIKGQRASSFGLIVLWAGSLDDPTWFRPATDIFVVSAQPWDYMNPTLRKFEHTPTTEQAQELLTARG